MVKIKATLFLIGCLSLLGCRTIKVGHEGWIPGEECPICERGYHESK